MPGSDTKNLTEVEKWKIYAEVCKWTDQKTGKIVNNGVERIIEGVKVENIKVKERTAKKIKQAVDEFRRQGKPADLIQKDKEGRRSLLTGDLKDEMKAVAKEFSKSFRCYPPDVCCGALYARHGVNIPRTSTQRRYELLHAEKVNVELKPPTTETNKLNRLSHVYKQIAPPSDNRQRLYSIFKRGPFKSVISTKNTADRGVKAKNPRSTPLDNRCILHLDSGAQLYICSHPIHRGYIDAIFQCSVVELVSNSTVLVLKKCQKNTCTYTSCGD